MTEHRAICDIARDIAKEWPKPNFAAVPYLNAMKTLRSIGDDYGFDSAKSIILCFLSNASTFRGERAKELKKELKKIAGVK